LRARIGRTTGHGIAGNIHRNYPNWMLQGVIALMLAANTINIGADIGAMADAVYATIAVATLVGILINFSPINPIRALYWSAVINGVAAVPIMAMMMHMIAKNGVMGRFPIHDGLRLVGWVATGVMGVAAVAMIVGMVW
jgi:Mn2+/Fe2+ NRAMP family transporter